MEDNEINQEIARELLSMAGLEVACAVDGRQAVELFEENPPDTYSLILMDIQMPVLNGYEATRKSEAWRCKGRTPPVSPSLPLRPTPLPTTPIVPVKPG